jgi:iron complex outermembrane receptor protein
MLTIAMPGSFLFAQETEKKEEKKTAEEQKPKVTEEVTVTARKIEETIQEVPISVAAPTESELRDRGAETMEDVAANVAGFSVQNLGPGQSQVAIRGISSGQIVRDQPGVKEGVGIYLDESVISLSLFTPDIDLFDLSRIEVLRGPQGTLFGAGSQSGTVRYITNQPKIGASETVGELTLSSISGGGVGGSVKAAVNVPMGDTAAMRVAAYYTSYGGYMDAVQPNLSVKKDVNSGTRTGARVMFGFKPTTALTITPRILYQEVKMDGWNRIDAFNVLGNPFTTTQPAVNLGPRELFTQIKEPFTDKFTLGDVNIGYNFGGTTLTSVTSYTDRDVLVVRDATALTGSITGGSPLTFPANVWRLDAPLSDKTRAKVFTQEVRLAGSVPRLQWLAGAYYTDINRKYGQDLLVSGFSQLTDIPTAGQFGAATDVLFFSRLDYNHTQYALFGEATYSLTDRFDLTGGLRYYNFKEDREQVFDGIFADATGPTAGKITANGIAPRVIAAFKLSDANRLYASVSKGFRLGGINDQLNVPLCTPQDLINYGGHPTWDDETLWNYEVGSKSQFMEGRGSLNLAAFRSEIKDLQAILTAGSCSSRIVLNVPKARSTGGELEFALAPSEKFDFAISASQAKSSLRSNITVPDANGNPVILAGIKSGNRLPSVPENQFAAAATYHWQASGNWAGYVTGAFHHVGSRFTQVGDQAAGFGTVPLRYTNMGGPFTQSTFTFDPLLPAYDLLNVRFGVLKNKWDIALFVNNVTDERALLALDQERGTNARVGFLTNQPRTFGISTRVNY